MKNLTTRLSILAFAMSLAGPIPALAEMNNNPAPGSGGGIIACDDWCYDHNKSEAKLLACYTACGKYWCKGNSCRYQEPGEPAKAPPGRPIPTKPILHHPGPVTTPPAQNQPVILEKSSGEHSGGKH
jgi:hypothetical protein